MRDQITKIVDEMAEELVEAKIPVRLLRPTWDDLIPEDILKQGLAWLEKLYHTTYEDVQAIRRLLPKEIWERYDKWGDFESFREVVLLRERQTILRRAVWKRPKLFRKGALTREVAHIRKALEKAKRARAGCDGAVETDAHAINPRGGSEDEGASD